MRDGIMMVYITIFEFAKLIINLQQTSFQIKISNILANPSNLRMQQQIRQMMNQNNKDNQDEQKMQQMQIKHQNEVISSFMSYRQLVINSDPTSLLYEPDSKRISQCKYYQIVKEKRKQLINQALQANQKFLNEIVNYCEGEERVKSIKPQPVSYKNFSRIKTTVKQFYREWCDESPELKDYLNIVQKAKKYLKPKDKICAPGSGLGRLVLELVEAGFGCQGNEVSYFMLYGSNFILNSVETPKQYKIYPFLTSTDYYRQQSDIFRSVLVPDKAASQAVSQDSDFSMSAGQFTEVYNRLPEQFNGMATCFFIDTANNIFDYVNTIYLTLKQKGIWINYGPLLFHYRQMYNQVSIEVSWESLRLYIEQRFQFLEESISDTSYCHDEKAQMGVNYNCISFVCRKKSKVSK